MLGAGEACGELKLLYPGHLTQDPRTGQRTRCLWEGGLTALWSLVLSVHVPLPWESCHTPECLRVPGPVRSSGAGGGGSRVAETRPPSSCSCRGRRSFSRGPGRYGGLCGAKGRCHSSSAVQKQPRTGARNSHKTCHRAVFQKRFTIRECKTHPYGLCGTGRRAVLSLPASLLAPGPVGRPPNPTASQKQGPAGSWDAGPGLVPDPGAGSTAAPGITHPLDTHGV